MSLRAVCTACIATVAACAPVTTTRRVLETTAPGGVTRDPGRPGAPTVTVEARASGVLVASIEPLTCTEREVALVHRTEIVKRHVNTAMTVFEYVLGAALAGAGAYTIAQPSSVASDISSGTKPDDARNAGIAAAGVGGLFLVFGVVNSIRGGTEQHALPDERRPAAAGKDVACGTSPRAGDAIALAIGDKRWPLGTTDKTGALAVPWDKIPDEAFDGEWHAAKVATIAAAAPIDLAPARTAAAERAWTELRAQPPSLAAAKVYFAKFSGTRDAEVKTMIATLADQTYAPELDAAIAKVDVAAAKDVLAKWTADAPDSALRAQKAADVAALEQHGGADALVAKVDAALGDPDPAKLAAAQQAVDELARVAPGDARLADARARVEKRRTTQLASAKGHADKARHFARHSQWTQADAELAEVARLAPNDPLLAAAMEYVDKYKTAAGVAVVKDAQDARDHAAAAAEVKAKAEEQARAAAAERAEKARAAADAKAKAEEQARAAADDKARAAADAKAKAEEQARAAADDKARAAADAKAKAEEQARVATDAKTRAAADAKARAAEAERIAAEAKARAAEEAERRRLEAAAERVRAESARVTVPAHVPVPARAPSGLEGMWATLAGDAVWLVELRAGGDGRTAVWLGGRIVAMRAIHWRTDGDALVIQAGASQLRGIAHADGRTLAWASAAWRRQ